MATSKDPEGKRQGLMDKLEEEEDEEEEEEEDEDIEELGFRENEKKKKKMRASHEGSSASPTSCQADNCAADLSTEAKPYHRRHKVCEFHAKSPLVTVAGLHQRFCQQCSRFHSISEFDETKKSCRKRLAGHNARRRKNLIS